MKDLNEADFDAATADGTVLVEFTADWCTPCQSLATTLDQLSGDYASSVGFYTIDADEEPSIAARHGVMSLPTILLFKAGDVVERKIGEVSEHDLRSMIESHM